jgi:hypothetical protein
LVTSSNHDISNEVFIKICPICKSGINQYLNDDKGHHQATSNSNGAIRKYMHDNVLYIIMNFLKLARVTALKESPDVFDIPDFFLRRNPLFKDNPDTAYDLFIVHPDT